MTSCKDHFSERLSTKMKLRHSCPGARHYSRDEDATTPGGGEEYEKMELDPLVFDREEFNSGESRV